ncbi:MAG TPA: hypothetical protein DHW42_10210 [Candidatus Marinimicrobia bacterium]|nr:hypothetical protein [Candidatus Neomarinimicrobiota bacterium]
MRKFGDLVKDIRVKKRMTLRTFCKLTQIDPGNWSKIERGILSPPKSREVLNQIACVLNIEKNSDEYNALFDYAAIGHIPIEITEQQILQKLPMFFRTARGEQPSEEELKSLIEIIRKDQNGVT